MTKVGIADMSLKRARPDDDDSSCKINKTDMEDLVQVKRQECLSRIFKHIETTGQKFEVIYMDPPYEFKNNGPLQGKPKYDTMKLKEIAAIPIGQFAEKASILLVWTSSCMLLDVIRIIQEKWGFKFKTIWKTWLKVYPSGKPRMGIGFWTRNSTEHLLLATRGAVGNWRTTRSEKGVQLTDFSDLDEWSATEIGKHSEKPNIFRERIVSYFGNRRRLEMFGRVNEDLVTRGYYQHWSVSGFEVPNMFFPQQNLSETVEECENIFDDEQHVKPSSSVSELNPFDDD